MNDASTRSRQRVPATVTHLAVAASLILVFALQAFYAAREDSVTIDEFVHLPVGLYMASTGDFAPDPINPPLARMIAAAPLLFSGLRFQPPPAVGHWGMGYLFMQQQVGNYQALYIRARTMIILLGCALAGLVFAWAAQVYGADAAVAAVFLFAFSPEMLAHAHLVTLDLAGALGFTATAYAFWWLLARPGRGRAALLGLVFGVSVLLKLSALTMAAAILPAAALRWFERRRHGEPASGLRAGGEWLGITAATALLTINLGYGFQGTFADLRLAAFRAGGALEALRAAAPWLRLPVPLAFLNGVDQVLTTGIVNEPSYFLAGELSARGWWYYHLAAFALKTPLPLLILLVVATVAWISRSIPGERAYCLFVPLIFVFVFNSLFNSLYIGVRHVLPAYPLLFVVVAPLVAGAWQALRRGPREPRALMYVAGVALALVWLVFGTAAVAPRYLQFFNELAGGAEGGHRYLVDSNLDWGQDLIRLKRYMDANGVARVNLAYFGRVDPAVYGIGFEPLSRENAHGKTVVSASFLQGRPYFWLADGELRWIRSGTYGWLQHERPAARVGALFVYDLP